MIKCNHIETYSDGNADYCADCGRILTYFDDENQTWVNTPVTD